MNYTTFITKYIFPLFAPINESMNVLREIDFKLDAQKISEVLGALKTVEKIYKSKEFDDIQIKLALHDFSRSYEYFDLLLTQTMSELDKVLDPKGVLRGRYVASLVML